MSRSRNRQDLEAQLKHASGDLDQVIADVSGGIRSQSHYDDVEDRVHGIAKQLKHAVRRP